MVATKISQSQHSLGTEDDLLDRILKSGIDCVLDAGNRKFYGTLRIAHGTRIFSFLFLSLSSCHPVILSTSSKNEEEIRVLPEIG